MNRDEYVEQSFYEMFHAWLMRAVLWGAFLFLCFSLLDYFAMPEHFKLFLICRIAACLFLLGVFILAKRAHNPNFIYSLSYFAIAFSAVIIEIMILKSGGHESPYYVGLILLVIAALGYLPARLSFHAYTAITVYAIYLLPIILTEKITHFRLFFLSNFFLVSTFSIILLIKFINYRSQKNEFNLRYDLNKSKDHLEEEVRDRTHKLHETVDALKREIAEKNQIEARLKKASDEWRVTVDSTQDVIIMLDCAYTVVKVNKAATVYFNKPFQEMIGCSVLTLFSDIGLKEEECGLSVIREAKRHSEVELQVTGGNRWILLAVDPVANEKGGMYGAVLIIRDITEIREMQDSIRQARDEWEETFNVINDAITIHDKEFNIIRANTAASSLLGQTFHGFEMKKCFQCYHGTDSPPRMCPSCESIKSGKLSVTEMFEPHLGRHLEMKAIPRTNAGGEIIGLVHVVRDITEGKRAEEEQKKLHAEFLQIQKMDSIGRLAGGVAHDFNNILSAVLGYSELAMMKVPHDHPVAENLRIINDAGERGVSLNRQLLAFSRKQVMEMKVINPDTIIKNMYKMLVRLIGEHISLEIKTTLPTTNILGDSGQIEQVLLNLAVNARDAMPQGGNIVIETEGIAPDGQYAGAHEGLNPGRYACISVTDTGSGISKELQDRIFEPFFTTKEMGKGTGLGLSTVYGIVKQHGGHISVESELGYGTTFRIFIPVIEEAVSENDQERDSVPMRGTETILAADDEPYVRKLITDTLVPLGYKVLEAADGAGALRIVNDFAGSIDLLLTDVIMPGMNGRRLADLVQAARTGIETIFLSGYTDDMIARHGMLAPGVVFLQKPVTPGILALRVRQVLDRKKLQSVDGEAVTDLHGLRLLLVDDDEASLKLAERFLEGKECHIDSCKNGGRALEMFKTGGYDLVLMDLLMPDMDGYRVIRAMREWEKESGRYETPIIAISGNSSCEDAAQCNEAGFTALLAKPLRKKELTDTVTRHVKRNEKERISGHEKHHGNNRKIVVTIDFGLKDLIPGYVQARRDDIESILRALAGNDFVAIRVIGHSMKGSGGGYGFDAISEIGFQIEQAALNEDRERITDEIEKLAAYLERMEIIFQ